MSTMTIKTEDVTMRTVILALVVAMGTVLETGTTGINRVSNNSIHGGN